MPKPITQPTPMPIPTKVQKRAIVTGIEKVGLEFALAIPGNIGGAIWANAGAHGGEMVAITTSITLLRADGTEVEIPVADAAFSYRESRFKGPEGGGEVIRKTCQKGWKFGCVVLTK